MAQEKTQWGWGNYLKPTPDNIQYAATALKAIIMVVAGTVWVNGNPHTAMIVMVIGAILDEVSKFCAKVSHDIKESTEVKVTHKVEGQPDEVKEIIINNEAKSTDDSKT